MSQIITYSYPCHNPSVDLLNSDRCSPHSPYIIVLAERVLTYTSHFSEREDYPPRQDQAGLRSDRPMDVLHQLGSPRQPRHLVPTLDWPRPIQQEER